MTVYKYFIKIALRYKLVILGYTAIFMLLSIVNGASTDTKDIQFIETRLDIGIVDNMNSELSQGLVDYLSSKNNIVEIREEDEYIREQIWLQVVDGVIIIPEDFDEKIIAKEKAVKIYNNDREIGRSYLEQQVVKYFVFANATYEDGKFDLSEVKTALDEKVNIEVIKNDTKYKNTNANNWFKYYFNFASYIIIAIYVSVIGLVMAEFKDQRIEDRIRVSSKKFLQVNKEIYLGQVVLGYVITLIFILGSILLKGKHIGEVEFSKYIINIVVFSFSILCFTFLINNLTKNRFIINGISTVASLGTAFISGVMVPQEFLSKKVLSIAKFFPVYYYVNINDRSISYFSEIRYEIIMQIMFGIVFLLMGLYFSKLRQKA